MVGRRERKGRRLLVVLVVCEVPLAGVMEMRRWPCDKKYHVLALMCNFRRTETFLLSFEAGEAGDMYNFVRYAGCTHSLHDPLRKGE